MSTPRIPGLPELDWTHGAGEGGYDAATATLRLVAAAGTDWTNDATGHPPSHTSTALAFAAPDEPFRLRARVCVDGARTTYDAGVIALWSDADHWAKLCFENSPDGEPMVVSVVTDGLSDDANAMLVDADHIWLRVSRLDATAWAFHASIDGRRWRFVRQFPFTGGTGSLRIGFLSQAPNGDACVARFDDIVLTPGAPSSVRDGS